MPDAELSVSTRPAFLTAVTRVDSSGLADAAVATGAVAMPVKLPAPPLGTEAQPGPKSLAVVDAPEDAGADAAEEAGAEVAGAAADDEDGLELQAAAVRARPAARPVVASKRIFMISPISYLKGVPSGDGHHYRVPAGGPAGKDLGAPRRLGHALVVGGPDLERVQPGGRVPGPDPLPPGVDAVDGGQPGGVPGTVVRADLYRGDAGVGCPGHPGHRDLARGDLGQRPGHVDPRLGVDRGHGRVPALGPVGLLRGEGGHGQPGDRSEEHTSELQSQ